MIRTHQIGEYEFYKDNADSKIWNVNHIGCKGELLFSFDGETMINLWTDYPDNLTKEQKKLFDKEEPYWADFFSDDKY